MHDKLFLFLCRGSELEGEGIRIQSSPAWEVWSCVSNVFALNCNEACFNNNSNSGTEYVFLFCL